MGSSCGSTAPRARTESSREEAQAATADSRWSLAAERWYGVFLSEGRPADACANAARAMIEQRDFEGANQVLEAGIVEHPADATLLELQGEVLVALGFRRAAEEVLARAVELDPGRVEAWTELAKARIALGLEGAAVEPLRKVIELGGGDYAIWRLLARSAHASGDAVGAFQAYSKAFELGPGSSEDLVEAALLFLDPVVRRSQPEAAQTTRAWLERALALDPRSTRAHCVLGVVNEELRRPGDAIEHYRKAIESDPSCLMALTNLAILYRAQGDEANARVLVERAIALESHPDRKRALQRLLERKVAENRPSWPAADVP